MGQKQSIQAHIVDKQTVHHGSSADTIYSISVKMPASTSASFGNDSATERTYTIHKRSDEFHTLARELRSAYGSTISQPMHNSQHGYNSWLQSLLTNSSIVNAHQLKEWLAEQLQDYNADEDDENEPVKSSNDSKPIMKNSVMSLQTVASTSNLSEMNLVSLADGRQSSEQPAASSAAVPYNILRDFTLLKVIGKGSFGKVMLVRQNSSGRIFAMKVLHKDQVIKRNQVDHTRTERSVMGYVKHPFIVRLRFAFQSKRKLYLVMDYFAGGELFFHLGRAGRFSEPRAKFYAAQIVEALEYLHTKSVVYRDLKPENVLLDANGYCGLTDFGLSKEGVSDNKSANSFCGTPEYLAPEILTRSGHGRAADWWSLGALLFEMLTGMPPFFSRNRDRLFQKILQADVKFPRFLSEDAKDLLKRLLDRNPETRLGSNGDAQQIKDHPWFSGMEWEQLLAKKIQAPFKPHVTLPTDTANFDAEFTSLPLDSIGSSLSKSLLQSDPNMFKPINNQNGGSNASSANDNDPYGHSDESDKFAGFSYVNQSELMMSPPREDPNSSVLSAPPADEQEKAEREKASQQHNQPEPVNLQTVHRQVGDLSLQDDSGAGEI